MQVKLKSNLLLIRKHTKTGLTVDMELEESDEDKGLVTGEVLASEDAEYPVGTTVIYGRYALLSFALQGEDFFVLAVDDVIGTSDYKE